MPNIGPVELIIILVIALIVIGPGRLPDVGAALGKSIREFRKASSDITDATRVDTSPLPPAAPAVPAASAPAPTAPPPAVAPAAPVTPSTSDDEAAGPPACPLDRRSADGRRRRRPRGRPPGARSRARTGPRRTRRGDDARRSPHRASFAADQVGPDDRRRVSDRVRCRAEHPASARLAIAGRQAAADRKSTRLNSSHMSISY